MNASLFLSFLFFSKCAFDSHAFSSPSPRSSVRRPDASAAVEEALKVTATHGLDSSEAKVAWDIVEELDAR